MQRLLERLDRKLQWTLIAPRPEGAMDTDEVAHRDPALLQRALQMRADVGLAPEPSEPRYGFSAAGAWHLIATDASGEVAGTVRLYVIDRQREALQPADIPHLSHVQFPCAEVQEQHLLVLQQLFDAKADERHFVAAGGMFTTPAWRGSGLAAVLGMAAIAMARLRNSRFSASYTAVRGQAQDLFALFGGRPPLLPNGQSLAPFFCQHYGMELQLLVFDSRAPEPRAEAGVHLMAERLSALMPDQEQAA